MKKLISFVLNTPYKDKGKSIATHSGFFNLVQGYLGVLGDLIFICLDDCHNMECEGIE